MNLRPVQSGLTLIELVVALAVVIILGITVVPFITDMLQKQRLVAAVEAVHGQFVQAKSESFKRSSEIIVGLSTGSSWHVGVSDRSGCDSSTGDCRLRYVEADGSTTSIGTAISSTEYPGVTLSSTGTTFTFDPVRKTMTSGTVTLDTSDYQAKVETSVIGRVLICSPSGTKSLGRYEDCD